MSLQNINSDLRVEGVGGADAQDWTQPAQVFITDVTVMTGLLNCVCDCERDGTELIPDAFLQEFI